MRMDRLEGLRSRIKQIEKRTSSFESTTQAPLKDEQREINEKIFSAWHLGTHEVDQCFSGGLSPHALHEITPCHYKDSWAALSFALALLSCRTRHDKKPILWSSSLVNHSEFGRLCGHGLKRFNLDPARFILIEARNDKEMAFIMEEALKSGQLSGVLGLINTPDLVSSRRLSLMANKGKTPALLITKPKGAGIRTAASRWRVEAKTPDETLFATFPFYQLGWQVTLTRNRMGPADKQWHLEYPCYELPLNKRSKKAFRFTLPSPFRNRKSNPLEVRIKAA